MVILVHCRSAERHIASEREASALKRKGSFQRKRQQTVNFGESCRPIAYDD